MTEVFAVNQLHHHVGNVAFPPYVIDSDYALVDQLAGGQRFLSKARLQGGGFLLGQLVKRDCLDCNFAVKARIPALIDIAHPAFANGVVDPVAAKLFEDGRHGVQLHQWKYWHDSRCARLHAA